MDADALDVALARWAQAATVPAVIAVDGKEVREAKNGGGTTVHLLSALDHASSTVLAQVEVGVKTNEVPRFPVLLDEIGDLAEVVVTADALHAQRPRRLPAQARRPLRVHGQGQSALPAPPAAVLAVEPDAGRAPGEGAGPRKGHHVP